MNVTAVVVTYGDRASLAIGTVLGASRAGVDSIVLVDNDSTSNLTARLEHCMSQLCPIHIVEMGSNTGSAKGFAAGIAQAVANGADYLWLLDDDNWAADDSLHALTQFWAISALDSGRETALLSFRPRRPNQAALRAGQTVDRSFPPTGSFLYLDIWTRLRERTRVRPSPTGSMVTIPYAPYGGLFFPASLVDLIGLPNESLVLYEDDTEFSARICERGGVIHLVFESLVLDAEQPYLTKVAGTGPARLLTSPEVEKILYATRNRAYFDRRRRMGKVRKVHYFVNRTVYITYLLIQSLRLRRVHRAKLLVQAIRDGERGYLGKIVASDS